MTSFSLTSPCAKSQNFNNVAHSLPIIQFNCYFDVLYALLNFSIKVTQPETKVFRSRMFKLRLGRVSNCYGEKIVFFCLFTPCPALQQIYHRRGLHNTILTGNHLESKHLFRFVHAVIYISQRGFSSLIFRPLMAFRVSYFNISDFMKIVN